MRDDYTKVPLTKGKFAMVDIDDLSKLGDKKWCLHSMGYACRRSKDGKIELMHRVITNAPKGMYVDHINRDTLDNRSCNLRIVTNSENLSRSVPKSGLKGVSWHPQMKQWRARMTIDGHEKHLGLFDNKNDAILKYNDVAKQVRGEYAWLNEIH